MSYLSIYRKFRPTTFDKVIGQEHITTTLINQIKNDRLGHAYLFCGSRGTGKTTTAKIFAKAINCLNPKNGSPCLECENCKKLSQANNPDIMEIDAASNNKVENVREIREKIMYPPVVGKYRVYIIDEVHMLTTEAFNALLKTLEEPPKHAVFILATTEVYKIPATILSRCMRFDFRLVGIEETVSLLKEVFNELGREYELDALYFIARAGEGCVRDCLSVAEICSGYTQGKITLESVKDVMGATNEEDILNLTSSILKGETGNTLVLTDRLINLGKSVGVIFKDLTETLRECMLIKNSNENFLGLTSVRFNLIKQLCSLADNSSMIRIMEILSYAEGELRYSSQPRIVLETALIKAGMPSSDNSLEGILARLNRIESGVAVNYKPTEKPFVNSYSSSNAQNTTQSINQENISTSFVEKTNNSIVDSAKKQMENSVEKPIEENKKEESIPKTENRQENTFNTTKIEVPNFSSTSSKNVENIDSKKIWGTIIRSIRKVNIALYAICSDRSSSIEGNTLYIYADSQGDYLLLTRQDNFEIISKIAMENAGLNVEIIEKSDRLIKQEEINNQLKEVEDFFGKNKIN